jgi:hypothetical protein
MGVTLFYDVAITDFAGYAAESSIVIVSWCFSFRARFRFRIL